MSAISATTNSYSSIGSAAQFGYRRDQAPETASSSDNVSQSPTTVVSLSQNARVAATTSAGAPKDFTIVAQEARATIDAGYQKLGTDSRTFYVSATREQVDAVLNMDRRSLFAVASNKDGLFTANEQDLAKSVMSRQQGDAMGLSGPLSALADYAANYAAGIKFLDGVSAEEKAGSFEWAMQRASMQDSYERLMRRDGKEPENFDTAHPLVKMLKGALEAYAAAGDPSKRIEDLAQYKQAQQYHAATTGGAANLVDQTA